MTEGYEWWSIMFAWREAWAGDIPYRIDIDIMDRWCWLHGAAYQAAFARE